ncbi:hypothetical protein CH75_24450 [Dyella jiangningensis]|nr:hypothetical protein CH75_01370 [Dyella jiangningensis]AHX16511.1 hypothetical protein CH75_24450 [Dyella jiangningensis]
MVAKPSCQAPSAFPAMAALRYQAVLAALSAGAPSSASARPSSIWALASPASARFCNASRAASPEVAIMGIANATAMAITHIARIMVRPPCLENPDTNGPAGHRQFGCRPRRPHRALPYRFIRRFNDLAAALRHGS